MSDFSVRTNQGDLSGKLYQVQGKPVLQVKNANGENRLVELTNLNLKKYNLKLSDLPYLHSASKTDSTYTKLQNFSVAIKEFVKDAFGFSVSVSLKRELQGQYSESAKTTNLGNQKIRNEINQARKELRDNRPMTLKEELQNQYSVSAQAKNQENQRIREEIILSREKARNGKL